MTTPKSLIQESQTVPLIDDFIMMNEEEKNTKPYVNFVYMLNGNIIIGSSDTEDTALAFIPEGSNYKFVLNNELELLDKDYLDSYVLENREIKPTLEKTKEVKKRLLRIERKPQLEALDVDFMRAIENGDTELQAMVVQEKKRLRDITNSVDLAKTIDEVKKIAL